MENKFLVCLLMISVLFITSCAGNKEDISVHTSPITSTVKKENEMKINITVGNQTFAATLENNQTANAFKELLPMTIDMEDVNRNEKYYNLSNTIRKEKADNPGRINAGDIMCYGDAGVVLFYKTFSTNYSYAPIGHIEDVTGLEEALGTGNIEITFSIS